MNQRADGFNIKRDGIEQQLTAYGQRECDDWITQWQSFQLATRRRPSHRAKVRHVSPTVNARLAFLTPGRVIGLSREKAVVLRQYLSRGQVQAMVTALRRHGRILEYPIELITEVFDHVIDIVETRSFPWCRRDSMEHASHALDNLPTRLRPLPIRVDQDPTKPPTILTEPVRDAMPCPTCPSRHACSNDHAQAFRLRQEWHRLTTTIHTLRTELWHQFQHHVDVLQRFHYLTASCQLTSDGEWARLIRINHSLLLTELIRMDAFIDIEPAWLTGVLASIAHDDDRPRAFPRRSAELSSILKQVRTVAQSLGRL